MLSWIIDDLGHTYQSGSPELARSLGYTTGGRPIEQYAIENIGHIALTEHSGRVHVRCRPALISQKATAELFYRLLDHSDVPVVLSWFEDVWHMERPMTFRVAVAFINLLLDKRSLTAQAGGPRILSMPSAAARQLWEKTARAVVPTISRPGTAMQNRDALDGAYHGRWMLVDLNFRTNQILRICRGDGYPPLGRDLFDSLIDFDLRTIPDTDYRDWVVSRFFTAAERDMAQFESVDAIIGWPRTGDIRTRYWRIVTPVSRTKELCRLLSVSGGDSSINLRPDLVQKHA